MMYEHYLMKKNDLFYQALRLISLNCVVFSFKICFFFSFCSGFSLEARVVKTDGIRDLKQMFTSCFFLIGKKNFQNN